MNNEDQTSAAQVALAQAIKTAKDSFSPVLQRELYTQLAKEHKIIYDAYKLAGFTTLEAMRLLVKCFD